MSHYEQRLAADKTEIRERVVAIGRKVETAVSDAVRALLAANRNQCFRIMLGDLPINREIRAIDHACHVFVARHLPSAGHLRFVSSVLQMNVALERIGDYAVTIAREAVQLDKEPPPDVAKDIAALSEASCSMLADAVSAFADGNEQLARRTVLRAKESQERYATGFRCLIQAEPDLDLELGDAFALFMVFRRLQRVSDQAKNLCEETLFELTGETKPPKRYNVLFVDARDTLLGPLAVALARKAFPESGNYQSAGFSAGQELAPELSALAAELSLDLEGAGPTPLDASREALEKYHVIVCLTPDAAKHIRIIPYASALLEWELPRLSDPDGGSNLDARLREITKYLKGEIRELMVLLRGNDAE